LIRLKNFRFHSFSTAPLL